MSDSICKCPTCSSSIGELRVYRNGQSLCPKCLTIYPYPPPLSQTLAEQIVELKEEIAQLKEELEAANCGLRGFW